MFGWFKKRGKTDLEVVNDQLKIAFSRVSSDITNMKSWLSHFDNRHNNIERMHQHHADITQRDIQHLRTWVTHLDSTNKQMQTYLKDLVGVIRNVRSGHDEITTRLGKLEAELDSRTSEDKSRTNEGQVKDKIGEAPNNESKVLSRHSTLQGFHTNMLTGSEIELLEALYYSDRPLSYVELSSRLKKESKSIRNLIYQLRKNGIDIASKTVAPREKGFFLQREAKIELSGR